MPGHDEPQIHLPPPSMAPVTIGIGVTILSFGILYGLALVALGGLIFLAGLAGWLIEDARAFTHAGDDADHGGRGGGHAAGGH